MLSQVSIIPNVPYEFRCQEGKGDIRLLDETGENTLLYIAFETGAGFIAINTCLNGEWGEELHLSHPPEGHPSHGIIWIKYNGRTLETWTEASTNNFERFDSTSAKQVRFMRMWGNAEHPGDPMNVRVLSPEMMGLEIDHHLLYARLDQIEKLVRSQNSNQELQNDA